MLPILFKPHCVNTFGPSQDGLHFPDNIFKCSFLNENVWISIKISLKFLPTVPNNNIPSLFQIMVWRRSGDKPLSETMVISWLTHICVTQPQWVKQWKTRVIGLTAAWYKLVLLPCRGWGIQAVLVITHVRELPWNTWLPPEKHQPLAASRTRFQYPIRCLIVRSRKVSELRDLYLELSDHCEMWQMPWQHCCWCPCRICEWYDDSNYRSLSFETSRDLTIICLIRYWK